MEPRSPTEPPLTAQIGRFARYILDQAGRRAALALVFLVLGSLTEGVSILLMVPVLHLVGEGSANLSVALPTGIFSGILGPELRLGLLPVLGFLVLLVLAQALFLRFKSIYMAELLYDVINRLRISLFDSIARARWRFVAGARGADFHHALTADIDRVQNAAFHLLLLVQGCVLLAAYFIVSWLISPAVTILALVTGGAMLAILHPVRRQAARYGALLTRNRQQQYRTVYEFLTGMKVAKSFNAEPRYAAELASTLTRMRNDYGHFVRLSSNGSVLVQVSTAVVLAAFAYAAVAWFALPMPKIVVLIFVFVRLLPRFTALQTDTQETLVSLPAFRAMQEMQTACDREREQPAAPAPSALRLERELRFERVALRYPNGPPEAALGDISFVAPARRITALIGASGSGKTTIADLMTGLLQPTAGAVTLDGVALDESNARRWRDQVAYVPQDVFLLHDSIAANLRLAVPDASDEMIWDALRAAHVDRFVAGLPERLATVVGDRGVRLSGGERQRIALARALLRRPQLLILDEATSALDWENQALIARSIKELRGSMTIVTIAHRLSMIAFADWVVALEGGTVVQTGPYDQLLDVAGGHLADLAEGERATTGRDKTAQVVSITGD